MLTALASHNPAGAEPATAPSALAAVPTPALADPHFFALPDVAPTYNIGKFDLGKFRKEDPSLSFDTVDLGKSTLRFDLVDNTTPRPEAPDLTDIIVPVRPGKKRSTPRYFGFTFSTPTH